MSKAQLPVKVDPRRCADQELSYEGVIQVGQLQRLASYLVDAEGEIEAELHYAVDEERIRHLRGEAKTEVRMLCQRCLEPVVIALNAELNLAFAGSEESAQKLPDRYDPYIVDEDGKQNVHEAIEEELILSLPLIAYHADCAITTKFEDPRAGSEEGEKPNPFAVLAQLKVNKD